MHLGQKLDPTAANAIQHACMEEIVQFCKEQVPLLDPFDQTRRLLTMQKVYRCLANNVDGMSASCQEAVLGFHSQEQNAQPKVHAEDSDDVFRIEILLPTFPSRSSFTGGAAAAAGAQIGTRDVESVDAYARMLLFCFFIASVYWAVQLGWDSIAAYQRRRGYQSLASSSKLAPLPRLRPPQQSFASAASTHMPIV